MSFRASLWSIIVLSLIGGIRARVVQDDWVSPSFPDESVTIRAGTTYKIEWTGQLYTWFADYAPSANISNVDLYITGTDNPNYQHRIKAAINVNKTRSFDWNVDLPDNELSDTPYYTFRFIRGGSTYTGPQGEQISSPRIIVRAAATTSTTSSATATSTPSRTSTAAAAATNIPASSTPSSRKLSGGAIAGIVIGAAAAVALFIALIWFVLTRRRKQTDTTSDLPSATAAPLMTTTEQTYSGNHQEFYAAKPQHLSGFATKSPPTYGQEQLYTELPGAPVPNRAQLP